VTAGVGDPLDFNWLAEYSTTVPLLATQRSPLASNATPMSLPVEPAPIVMVGAAVALVSCAAVNATTVGGAMAFATQRFPAVARVWPVVPGEVVLLELHPIARAPVSATSSPAEGLLMVGLQRSMVMLLVEIG
jgi:hypothetical protein